MKTPRILVVEDEAIIARDIQQQLVDLGYEVVGHTPTAEEALTLASNLKPDLVLMDINLAGRMDGIEAAQEIRRNGGTPVVFLTAFAGAETLDRAKLTEPFGYIIKPFDERYLQAVIEMALYKHTTETRLRRAYDEQAAILRTAIDGFFMADSQGRLLDVNDASCSMLGYSREELLRFNLSELHVIPHPSGSSVEGLTGPETARFEGPQRTKDGRTIQVEMAVNYLAHSGGRIFCFARDVTERRAAEQRLRELNEDLEGRVKERTQALEEARKEAERANNAKASFLATMTHELRTPLNGIMGTVEALRQTNLERDQVEMIELVAESGATLLGIVDDILDFSKIEAGRLGIESVHLSPHDVVEKVCAIVGPIADKANVELTLFTDPKLPRAVMGDPVRLRQVLLNLANNAVKFSANQARKSRVSIRAFVNVQSGRKAVLTFEVKDNGIGMDSTTQMSLFKSFTQGDSTITRRFGGTGLGLAISKNLVDLMGGDIRVESELGKGSVFTVTIPFLVATATPHAPEIAELTNLACLLVGEPEGLSRDLAAYLAAAGADVDQTRDLATARGRVAPKAKGMWIWIVDVPDGETPTVDSLRAEAGAPETDMRFVLIGRGRRRRPRPVAAGVVAIDGNLLNRRNFLNTVASAAGIAEIENTTVPVQIRRASRPPVPSREEAKARRQLILVAEDNDVNQKVIRRQLTLLGYAADIAPGGRQALEMWQSGDYALLLADLHMPEMDGYQLTAAIRVQETASQHAVIVALTADVLRGGAQQCRDAGLDDYLCKPARLSELKGMIEKWLPSPVETRPPSATGASATSPTKTQMPGPNGVVTIPASVERPIDISVLEELVGRDTNVIREFLRAFWISTTNTTAELKEAYYRKDLSVVADLSHKLKSPARSVGAMPLARICDDLERAGKAGDLAALEEHLQTFENERANVESYLRQT